MTSYIGVPFEIRWAERWEPVPGSDPELAKLVHVLQYGLRPTSGGPPDWFDVPTVEAPKV